jgi:MerR family mercuric resistance operon transcriptional regulator
VVQSQGPSLRIGAVARRAGVSVDTVRYYERRGLLRPAERLPSGYRLFPAAAVSTITLARRLQSLGMTLEEVADALRGHDWGEETCDSQRWRLEAALERTRARMAELAAVEADIAGVLDGCASGHCELRAP